MLKFDSPSITLSLLVQNCTVKAGCTVYTFFFCAIFMRASMNNLDSAMNSIFHVGRCNPD